MILGGVAGKDVFQILALTKWWTEWPIRILFANPLFESGPLLWHLAYPKLEKCHPVHLWFCVFISISSFSAAAEAAGWAEQESWRTGSVALTWAPNTGSDLKSWLMLVFRSDYLHLSGSLHLTLVFRCFADLIVCFSLEVEIVSITALNLARMELELDLHLQQVGLNRFIEVACYTSGSNLENGCILK